ncbi:MAG: [Fe-Fe] hydrogenase large subunit C-terminal domain-containing protein [Bacteroidales bacterium]
MGFEIVTEVSFGADLVSREYHRIFDDTNSESVITSDCPAVVNYVERYHPDLVQYLAPVASPAMAIAEVVRNIYGSESKVVFIGPCIAKKRESVSFDEVLTFAELRELFEKNGIGPEGLTGVEFDRPVSGRGAIFPVSHGLLHSINCSEGLGKGRLLPVRVN